MLSHVLPRVGHRTRDAWVRVAGRPRDRCVDLLTPRSIAFAGPLSAALIGAASVLGMAIPGQTAPQTRRPPNIIFFLADDLGYMDIGANNPRTFYETPHIDR